jgi:enoyl-CoA hydratase
MMCLLADAWDLLDADDDLRVAIFTGNGPSFCAGMDLAELPVLNDPEPANEWIARMREEPGMVQRGWLKIDLPTKPVILAVEGYARARGTEITTASTPRSWRST